ncbi:hypothetical protein ACFQ7F_16890 [Streptomyces sp. NPDC056486]|uniref:hypothetical protein n=1 Tax=Streptomyces sp. NPDC056486 TaxID=3345835 RepID=UPI0036AA9AA7
MCRSAARPAPSGRPRTWVVGAQDRCAEPRAPQGRVEDEGHPVTCFDHRIAALIALDGVYDLGDMAIDLLSLDRAEAERRLRADRDPELDAAVDAAVAAGPKIRWVVDQGMYVMGADTPRGLFATFLDYHLRDGIAQKVTCPTLVCSAADDVFFEGQPELLHEHLTCPKTLLEFTDVLGADAHCQAGAQRLAFARVYDWLDDVLTESA